MCISFTYRKDNLCNIPGQLSITGNATKIHWLLVLVSWHVHYYIAILCYITTHSSFLLVSFVLRLTSYDMSVSFWVYDSNMVAVFLTALKSVQSLVKGKYHHWCDSRNWILYSFMLSEKWKELQKMRNNTDPDIIF